MTALTLADVQEAALRIAPHIRHTPLQPSPALSAMAGRTLLLRSFTWKDVAARLVDAGQSWRLAPRQSAPPRIGWVTTWNTKCGIASYSEHLIAKVPGSVTVLAPHQVFAGAEHFRKQRHRCARRLCAQGIRRRGSRWSGRRR